ncbi:hypothetical protein BC835DRAFT_261431 [Cytidiella melzeri]|nr:hypothetical protein BC835DRAFT_261431 [Cytidiella melzeri]
MLNLKEGIEDPLLLILHYLSLEDILSFSQTCKYVARISTAKQLWLHVWRRDAPSHLQLSTQMLPLEQSSGTQTKLAVLHTLRLHHSMTAAVDKRSIRRVFFHQSLSVTWTKIIGSVWLLVAASDATVSVLSLFSVTSLLGSSAQDLVAQAFLEGSVRNGLVQLTAKQGVILALNFGYLRM